MRRCRFDKSAQCEAILGLVYRLPLDPFAFGSLIFLRADSALGVPGDGARRRSVSRAAAIPRRSARKIASGKASSRTDGVAKNSWINAALGRLRCHVSVSAAIGEWKNSGRRRVHIAYPSAVLDGRLMVSAELACAP